MGVEGTCIDPKLLKEGRNEDMEYMRKMGVFEVVDEKECDDNSCQTEVGGQDERREMSFEIGLSRDQRAKDRGEQLGPEDVFSHMPPSEGLKMLVSTMVTGHDDGKVRLRWQRGTCRERTSTVKLVGGFTHLPEGHKLKGNLDRLCRSMYGTRDAVSILRRHLVGSVERWFHESRNRVPSFLLKPRRSTQRFVSR